MKKFAITGVAGYVAPRHLKAIKETGNELVAALDPHDSVGILDSFFPNTSFFKEFERFDRHLEKLRRETGNKGIDFLSICSPNFLHDAHIRLALRLGANAICEKPLVLNPWNIDALAEIEAETGKKIFNVLQLREHKASKALKAKVENENIKTKYNITLNYITTRGEWYNHSWKGDVEKSGGVATNIGVHFFDLLTWIFGKVENNNIYIKEPRKAAGFLELKNANVKWFLSLEKKDLPQEALDRGMRTFRSLIINGEEFNFTNGFTDLHTKVYESILNGSGYGIEDARQSIEIVNYIRNENTNGKAAYDPKELKIG